MLNYCIVLVGPLLTSLKKTCGVSVILIMYTFCCCCSVAKSCLLFATPWNAARQDSLSFNIFQSLLKFMSTELVTPSNHLIFCLPLLAFNLSQHALVSISILTKMNRVLIEIFDPSGLYSYANKVNNQTLYLDKN